MIIEEFLQIDINKMVYGGSLSRGNELYCDVFFMNSLLVFVFIDNKIEIRRILNENIFTENIININYNNDCFLNDLRSNLKYKSIEVDKNWDILISGLKTYKRKNKILKLLNYE